jgi:hypothetical protein
MRRGAAAALAALLIGCAHAPVSGTQSGAPLPDSATVALWHMDEPSGTHLVDAGPFHLDATAGRDVTRPFGRLNGGLGFQFSLDSFVYTPFAPPLESPGALTIEAWLYPLDFGSYEDTPIVARWTEEANKQSWIFSIAGSRMDVNQAVALGPGLHRALFPDVEAGKVLFAYQPAAAGPPRAYVSTSGLELERWTHVAVTFDGDVVRFYIDGELDSQFASPGAIRSSDAPLLIGNYFDVRLLTGFGGDLHPETLNPTAYYAYHGRMDELRISNVARRDFPTRAPR